MLDTKYTLITSGDNGCEKSLESTPGVAPDSVDNTDTVKAVLDGIHELYGTGSRAKWYMVVGDQKIFTILQKLKRHYGSDLEWVKPHPGDWHLLKNFQPVLMKSISTQA